MKSLSNEQDVQGTMKALEPSQSWFIGIPDKKTPWYFTSLDYADGYVHWYDVGGGARRVVCAGGLAGKGFAIESCPICAYVLELYQEAKRLKEEEGDEAKAKQLKDRANRLRAKAEVQFKAVRGQRTLLKSKVGGKVVKNWIADWDIEDEDSTVGIGVISLSEAQFEGLTAMIKGENTPFITCGDDLGKRVLWTKKEHRKGKTGGKYSAVVWDADEEETDIPEMEIDEELVDMDLTENFEVDGEEIEKVYNLLSGQELEDPEEDEVVELEGDSEGEPENVELDDLAEDVDPEDEADDGEKAEKFEDDLIEDDPPKEEKSSKPTTRTATRKSGTGKTTTTKAKSGKRRL